MVADDSAPYIYDATIRRAPRYIVHSTRGDQEVGGGSCCREMMRHRLLFRPPPITSYCYTSSMAPRVEDCVAGYANRPGTSPARCALSWHSRRRGRSIGERRRSQQADALPGQGACRRRVCCGRAVEARHRRGSTLRSPRRRRLVEPWRWRGRMRVLVLGRQWAIRMCMQKPHAARTRSVSPSVCAAACAASRPALPPALTRAARVHVRLLESGSDAGTCTHARDGRTAPSTALVLLALPAACLW